MVSHCHLDLHFPDNIWYGKSFHIFISYPCIFFSEVSLKIFDLFYAWVLCFYCWCLSVLHVFWSFIKNIIFSNISFWSVARLLIQLPFSFTEQTFLILMESSLSFIYFMDVPLVLYPKYVTISKVIEVFSHVIF